MEEKKKFNPLAKDWLVGDVGKESDESQEEPGGKEDGFKNILGGKEDGFKNILGGKKDGFKNILEDEEVEEE